MDKAQDKIQDMGKCASPSIGISLLKDLVQKLYEFRDHYFEHHSIADAALKDQRLQEKLQETVKSFEEIGKMGVSAEERAEYFYLLGRAQDVMPKHSSLAEAALTKAVKLDPQMVDAWNQLGESYWKCDNMKEAKNCFQGALSKRKNKVSLRNLSMLVRQEAVEGQERVANVERGLALAREAVELDATDSESWLVLGNAYLSAFFNVQQAPATLKLAMKAYKRAESDALGKNNPDLHYNKAQALKFEEEYLSALEEFTRSCELSPLWDTPQKEKEQLINYLDCTVDLINTHGRLKAKKLQSLLLSVEGRQLGPYEGGQYTGTNGTSVKLQPLPLSALTPGINCEKVILGKVICSVRNDNSVPFTFCLMDKEKTVTAVTVYNLASGKGVIIGDSVAIPEPYVTHFNFSYSNKMYCFTSVRVDNPLVMVVNGKKVGRDKLAGTQLSTFRMSH